MTITDKKVMCNGGTSAELSAKIAAGSKIKAIWSQWTHEQGPVMVWMYKCSGAFSGCDGSGKKWFKVSHTHTHTHTHTNSHLRKPLPHHVHITHMPIQQIDQDGLSAPPLSSKNWGTAKVLKNLYWESTIPSSLAPGNYLIRHELLALHQAKTPQFYAECAQLEVTGSGSAQPSGDYLANIPGYASQSDPGVTVDTYSNSITSYTCPGPKVWSG
jgi:hypothetical protein